MNPNSFAITPDCGLVAYEQRRSTGPADPRPWQGVVKYDASGVQIWEHQFLDGTVVDTGDTPIVVADGSILLVRQIDGEDAIDVLHLAADDGHELADWKLLSGLHAGGVVLNSALLGTDGVLYFASGGPLGGFTVIHAFETDLLPAPYVTRRGGSNPARTRSASGVR